MKLNSTEAIETRKQISRTSYWFELKSPSTAVLLLFFHSNQVKFFGLR